ncbi:MAG: hypothetical protein HUK02_08575 [Bacteroidaceae bacterium]|nr:hypothetical protein [Bacteroidaceae bacterium]
MERNKNNVIYTAMAVVVAALVALLIFLFLQKRNSDENAAKLQQMQELAEMDKLEMQNEYEEFARQYSELQMQINNDSLVAQLEKEQRRVEELMEELKRTKNDDAAEIMRLKKELATLRAILRNYVMQIDSLNQLNQQLRGENENLRSENEQAHANISSLTSEKQSLTEKVAVAAQLDANNISAYGKNKKGKQATKVKDVKKFQINFNVARNVTAVAGMKSIFVRITTPTAQVLTHGGTFPYENRTLEYSIRKDIEYTGEEQAVTVYWDVAETLSAGQYRVDIFADGNLIGSTSFALE